MPKVLTEQEAVALLEKMQRYLTLDRVEPLEDQVLDNIVSPRVLTLLTNVQEKTLELSPRTVNMCKNMLKAFEDRDLPKFKAQLETLVSSPQLAARPPVQYDTLPPKAENKPVIPVQYSKLPETQNIQPLKDALKKINFPVHEMITAIAITKLQNHKIPFIFATTEHGLPEVFYMHYEPSGKPACLPVSLKNDDVVVKTSAHANKEMKLNDYIGLLKSPARNLAHKQQVQDKLTTLAGAPTDTNKGVSKENVAVKTPSPRRGS